MKRLLFMATAICGLAGPATGSARHHGRDINFDGS